MALSNRNISLLIYLILVPLISGCSLIDLNNESLEEYGNKVRLTMTTLVTYIGKNKEDVKKDFGDPTEIKHESGMIATHYQQDKVPFNEIWEYIYRRGIPGINAEGSIKTFFFNEDKVVSVDAF